MQSGGCLKSRPIGPQTDHLTSQKSLIHLYLQDLQEGISESAEWTKNSGKQDALFSGEIVKNFSFLVDFIEQIYGCPDYFC